MTQQIKRVGRWIFASLVVVAVAAMGYQQYRIRVNPADQEATALMLLAAAGAALLLGWRKRPVREPLADPRARRGWPRVLAWVAALAGGATILCGSGLLVADWYANIGVGWAVLLAGTALLSAALRWLDPRVRWRPWTRREVVVLLLIVLLGSLLRFHRYAEFPGPYTIHAVEEPQTGMGGHKILHYKTRPWEFFLDHYLAALTFSLTEDRTSNAVRFPFTVASVLGIAVVHMALRQMVSVPAALAGTFLFAVSSWNIIYSRCAHNIFFPNNLVVLVLALLFAFAHTQRLSLIPWVGVLAGVTLYSYAGYRGTTLFALLFLGLLFLRDTTRFARASDIGSRENAARIVFRDLAAAGLLLLVTLSVFAPIVKITTSNTAQPWYYFEAANRSLSNKQYYTTDSGAFYEQRIRRIQDTARIFMHRGDGSDTFNAPGEPMLDPLTATLFLGGLFIAALYFWRDFNAFLILMFLGVMFGGAVFVQNLDVRRLQGATPFVVFFAAIFADRVWAHLRGSPPFVRKGLLGALVLVAGVFVTWWNYDVYFHKMAGNPRVRQAFRNQYTSLIHYGQLHGKGREMLLLSDVWSLFQSSDYFWMVDGVFRGRPLESLAELLPPQPAPSGERPVTIVVQDPFERDAAANLIRQIYPGAACRPFVEPDNPHVNLAVCELPLRAARRQLAMSLEARYWYGTEPVGEPFATREEPFIGYALAPLSCRQGLSHVPACYAEWSGTLQVPSDGTYEFQVAPRPGSRLEVTVDGQSVAQRTVTLTAGRHEVHAQAVLASGRDAGVRLSWRQAGAPFEVVPFYRVVDEARAGANESIPPPGRADTADNL